MDFAMVTFDGVNAAANRFAAARDRSAPPSQWPDQVGLVEHHEDGHMVLRGMFAGQYIDADEALHISEAGAGDGWRIGALIGLLLGPPGFAVGSVSGAMVGSQVGYPTEADPEPKLLVDRLRAAVPLPGSAVVLVGDARVVDDMLGSLPVGDAHVTRRALDDDDLAVLNASLSETR